jgi:hypothetical protein
MEAMRSTWTDSRLDSLNYRVSEIGVKVDKLDDRLTKVDDRLTKLDERLTGRIDALQHTILLVGGGLFAAFVAVLAAIVGLIATQL